MDTNVGSASSGSFGCFSCRIQNTSTIEPLSEATPGLLLRHFSCAWRIIGSVQMSIYLIFEVTQKKQASYNVRFAQSDVVELHSCVVMHGCKCGYTRASNK